MLIVYLKKILITFNIIRLGTNNLKKLKLNFFLNYGCWALKALNLGNP